MIQETLVDNSALSTGFVSNPYACKDTYDNLFLLSYKEATSYFRSNDERLAEGTLYAEKHGLFKESYSNNGAWWLRSPDNEESDCAFLVLIDGTIHCNMINEGEDKPPYGIRPACWISTVTNESKPKKNIKISNDSSAKEPVKKETKKVIIPQQPRKKIESKPSISAIKRDGNTITFGSYYNKDDKTIEPLKWDILEEKDGKALIITHDIIDNKVFDINGSNNYENSLIRKWMNNDFYNVAFSDDEKKCI